MKVLPCTLWVLVYSLIATVSIASDLRAPIDIDNAMVLPRSVRSPRFKNIFMTVDEKFGGSGGAESLGNPLNKSVKWRDVINAQDALMREQTAGYLATLGFSEDDSAGNTTGIINSYANVKVPVFSMGLTDKWTLAVAVPIYDIDVNADTGFQKSAQGELFIASYCNDYPVSCQSAAVKLNDAINQKLTRLGYDKIKSEKYAGIGDVRVVSKHLVLSDERNLLAVRGELTLPTGKSPNADKALDVPLGDGQTDFGSSVIYDRYLDRKKRLRANLYTGYTIQFPDHLERRIPISDSDSLSSDKENLSRDLGDIFSSGVGLSYEFPIGLNLGASYGFQHQNKASFSGSRYDQKRYEYLSMNTRQVLHSATFGVGYSSVERYKAKKIPLPFQLNWTYSMPLSGIHVAKNDFMSGELVLFF